tara:strand:+ start:179 stop:511 length:333 start_codon:yes stop_codon:yes gene_type:complete
MTNFEFTEETMKFEKLTDKQCDYVFGRLKMLEEMADQIQVQRESYTRLLVLNGKSEDIEFNEAVMEHEKLETMTEAKPPKLDNQRLSSIEEDILTMIPPVVPEENPLVVI